MPLDNQVLPNSRNVRALPKPQTLTEYCTMISKDSFSMLDERDPPHYHELCHKYLVIPEEFPPTNQYSVVHHGSSMRDVLNRFISKVVQLTGNSYDKSRNLLSLGYRSKRWDSELELRNSIGVECFCINTLHSYFINPSWDLLLNRIGEDILEHILSRPILVPVRNGSFIQICGEPIPSIIFKPDTRRYNEALLTSSLRNGAGGSSCPPCNPSVLPQVVPRFKMFYKDLKCQSCLSSRHILNKVNVTGNDLVQCIFHRRCSIAIDSSALTLLDLCASILNGYRACDMWTAYKYHCESESDQKRKKSTEPVETKTRRRGKRGGRKMHRRQSVISIGNKSKEKYDDNGEEEVGEGNGKSTTVGERMMQRVTRNGILDCAVASQGYASQEEEDHNSCFLRTPHDQVLYKQAELGEKDCGWVHHVSMRTCATEQSDPDSPSAQLLSVAVADLKRKHISNANVTSPSVKNLLDMACPASRVCEFVKSVCRRLFPRESVWGSHFNHNLFMKSIDAFILLGRTETVTVHQLCSCYRTRDIPWLSKAKAFAGEGGHSGGTSRSKKRKRRQREQQEASESFGDKLSNEVLKCFIYWVFADVIIPFVASTFYVTEGEGTGTETLYFRKKDWRILSTIGEVQMRQNFMRTSGHRPDADAHNPKKLKVEGNVHVAVRKPQHEVICPDVRFVPKKTSMRAITNMSRYPREIAMSSKFQQQQITLTNYSLYNCLYVLRNIARRQKRVVMGFGVEGVDEACRRLRDYKLKVTKMRLKTSNALPTGNSTNKGCGGYYVAVLDLEKCFDSVNTAQLYDILRELVSSDGHGEGNETSGKERTTGNDEDISGSAIIHKYSVTHYINSAERFVCRRIRHVTSDGDLISFQEAADEISRHYQDAVINDGVVYSTLSRNELLRLIRHHLFSHMIRIPSSSDQDKYYTQVKGIPQGSVLSPLLCNIYYGSAESKIFGSSAERELLGLSNGSTIIIRVVDDYIAISTEKLCISYFLQRIHSCFGPFGGGVNPAKTRVNFDVEVEDCGERVILRRSGTSVMQWCGFFIDTKDLEVSPSFSRIIERPIIHSLSRDCFQIGVALRKSMKSFIRPKCQPIILDTFMNSFSTIVKSLFNIFAMAALRTGCYISGQSPLTAVSVSSNPRYIIRCILEVVRYGACLLKTRTVNHRGNRSLALGVDGAPLNKDPNDRNIEVIPYTTNITPGQAEWIGLTAFISEFSKIKRPEYKYLTAMLNAAIQDLEKRFPEQISSRLTIAASSAAQRM